MASLPPLDGRVESAQSCQLIWDLLERHKRNKQRQAGSTWPVTGPPFKNSTPTWCNAGWQLQQMRAPYNEQGRIVGVPPASLDAARGAFPNFTTHSLDNSPI
jgi:hypothetical protein